MFGSIRNQLLRGTVATISLVLVPLAIDMQAAHADDNALRQLLGRRPHFTTDLTNEATVPRVPDLGFSGEATGRLILVRRELKLVYEIETDMDLNAGFPQTPDTTDDVTQIHLHNAAPGLMGEHVLNVYKLPAQDDDNLTVRPNRGIVRGIWDDNDLSDPDSGLENPGPASDPLSDFLDELCAGNIYVNVHGTGDQAPGALRGNLEPTRRGERICRLLERLGEEGG